MFLLTGLLTLTALLPAARERATALASGQASEQDGAKASARSGEVSVVSGGYRRLPQECLPQE